MAVRKLKPTTPGQRHKIVSTFETITASKPEKSLVKGKTKSGGRNNTGKMTMRYIGGGHKRKYRVIDFKRNKDGVPATVKSIEYDPNRNARIALLYYADGEKRYIIAPKGMYLRHNFKDTKERYQCFFGHISAQLQECMKYFTTPFGFDFQTVSILHN